MPRPMPAGHSRRWRNCSASTMTTPWTARWGAARKAMWTARRVGRIRRARRQVRRQAIRRVTRPRVRRAPPRMIRRVPRPRVRRALPRMIRRVPPVAARSVDADADGSAMSPEAAGSGWLVWPGLGGVGGSGLPRRIRDQAVRGPVIAVNDRQVYRRLRLASVLVGPAQYHRRVSDVFSDLVGQDEAAETLRAAAASAAKIVAGTATGNGAMTHAWIFTGPP